MLSAIGLALDLVGAIALTLGLYRHSRPTYLGLARDPADVANDAAFGTIGATFLVCGFVLQGLQYVGVAVEGSDAANAAAALVTIVLAAVAGWLAFGLIWLRVHERERTWVNAHTEITAWPVQRVPQGHFGWKFWHHERTDV